MDKMDKMENILKKVGKKGHWTPRRGRGTAKGRIEAALRAIKECNVILTSALALSQDELEPGTPLFIANQKMMRAKGKVEKAFGSGKYPAEESSHFSSMSKFTTAKYKDLPDATAQLVNESVSGKPNSPERKKWLANLDDGYAGKGGTWWSKEDAWYPGPPPWTHEHAVEVKRGGGKSKRRRGSSKRRRRSSKRRRRSSKRKRRSSKRRRRSSKRKRRSSRRR